jgi:hypothetical protein
VLQAQDDVSDGRLRPDRRQLRRNALLRFADDVLLLSTPGPVTCERYFVRISGEMPRVRPAKPVGGP